MKKLMPRLKLKLDRSDLLFVLGGLVLCGGVWMIYRPAAVILLGVMLIVVALAEIKPKGG